MKRALRYFLLAAVLLAAAAYFLGESALGALGAYLVRAEPPHQADIAVVLAGDASGGRILKAAEFARQGYVERVLVSGPPGFYGHYECDLAIPFAMMHGYPESYFLHFENEALSTAEEAAVTVKELRRLGARDILIVTTDFHTRRAGRDYRAAAPDLRFTVVASPDTYFTPGGWWREREGRKTWLFESLKTVASWFGI